MHSSLSDLFSHLFLSVRRSGRVASKSPTSVRAAAGEDESSPQKAAESVVGGKRLAFKKKAAPSSSSKAARDETIAEE